jgi:hypothetical protein
MTHDPAAPRSSSRRLAWAAWLAAVVATSLGHGASISTGGSPAPVPSCVSGSVRPVAEGNVQTGRAGAPLGHPLAIAFVCTNTLDGQPMPADTSADVQWSVTSGGGTVNGQPQFLSPATGAGRAQVHWALGAGVIGTQTATATVSGQTLAFTATALPPSTGGSCTTEVSTTGTNFEDDRAIVGDQSLTLAGSPYRGSSVIAYGTLTIEPGVVLCLNRGLLVGGRLVARGTAAAPIRLVGDAYAGVELAFINPIGVPSSQASPSELVHVHAESMGEMTFNGHPVLMEDSSFAATPTGIGCPGVRFLDANPGRPAIGHVVRRTVFDGFGRAGGGACAAAVDLAMNAVPLAGPSVFEARVLRSAHVGVRVTGGAGTWAVSRCDISGSGSHGLQLEVDTGPVSGCSFSANQGDGLHNGNPSAFTVAASGNWWGGPGGPFGPGGDGASAGVDASMPLAAPPVLGY